MMIVCKNTNTEIKFDKHCFHTLVVENPTLLRNITYSFYEETPEYFFVFSKNYEPFEFRKKGLYLPSAVNLNVNNKKVLAKINAQLECFLTNELYAEFYDIKSRFSLLAEKLIQYSDYVVDCDYDITPKDIVKLLGVELSRGENDFDEILIRYVGLVREYLGVSLIVVSDLHRFFSKDELDSIFKTLLLNEICLLCVESIQPGNLSQYEQVHIIDNDLCEIR